MSKRFIFFLRAVSVTTAEGLTSLPVPAVVGMATTGSGSWRSAPKSSQSRGCPPLVRSRAMHLAVSMADPPPTATNASAPKSTARSVPARQSTSRGFGSTCWKASTSRPVPARSSRTGSASPAACTPGSVTSITLCAPRPAACTPAWAARPRPKNTRVGMKNSPSAVMPWPRRAFAGCTGCSGCPGCPGFGPMLMAPPLDRRAPGRCASPGRPAGPR